MSSARTRSHAFILVALVASMALPFTTIGQGTEPPVLLLAEVVTDPQVDRDGSGSVTVSDETVTILNPGPNTIDLTGWTLIMHDSKRIEQPLAGHIAAGARHVILNPDDQMNNDVLLELRRPDGTLADSAHLGNGMVDGNAADILDEAVHLVGPWRGLKGPSTGTVPLEAYWVRHVTPLNATPLGPDAHIVATSTHFGAIYLGPAATLTLDIRIAPGSDTTGLALVLEDGTRYPLQKNVDGTWSTDSSSPPINETAFRLEGPAANVTHYPGRDALKFLPDTTAPVVAAEPVIANATGILHAFPRITADGAALHALMVERIDNGTVIPLPSCRPLGAPNADCSATNVTTTIRIHAIDAAGNVAIVDRALTIDTTPPAPATIRFSEAKIPTLDWDPYAEPLARIVVEAAEDVTGVWPVAAWELDGTTTGFTDDTWTPGAPRAYRLVATDRAGNVRHSEWQALPPEAVPVETTPPVLQSVTDTLVRDGTVTLVLHFDRDMHSAPRLVFGTNTERPFRLTADGALDPTTREATYVVDAPEAMPRAGTATWRLEGGQGTDGAPAGKLAVAVAWDLEPPRLDVKGADPGWIRAARHVVSLDAYDTGGGRPRVDVDEKPDSAKVSGRLEARRVSFRGDGIHEIKGRVSDTAGNVAPFVVRVALDATSPTVTTTLPSAWSDAAPIHITVRDATSGVNHSSLSVWVRNATAVSQAPVIAWAGDVASLSPRSGTLTGAFLVHVAVADQAGNLAEGVFGGLPREKKPSTAAPPDAKVHGAVTHPGAQPAPPAKGPGWATGESGTGSSDAAARAERLREQYRNEPMTAANGTASSSDDGHGGVAYGILGAGGLMGAGLVARLARRRKVQRAPPEVLEAGRKV